MAVKLFSSANRQNYVTECSVYSLPLLQHDNVARFVAANERTAGDGRPEFLILLEYYPHVRRDNMPGVSESRSAAVTRLNMTDSGFMMF